MVTTKKSENQTEVSVKKRVKRIAKKWEKLLHVTGGKLVLSKCFWIPITWGWKSGTLVMKHKPRQRTELTLVDSGTGQVVTIDRIPPNKAEKRLGIRYSLDGKWTEEYRYWKKYSKEFAIKVSRANLDRLGGYHAYNTMWCSKFRYSSPVLGLTEAQLEKVQKVVIGNCLAAAGYSSKMPRAIVFGPEKYGGMAWESPVGMIVQEQIKLFIGSMRLQDTVGKLLGTQVTWLQLIAGTKIPVLQDSRTLPYLPIGWITSLRDKLQNYDITIEISNYWVPQIQRENDKCIMEYVIHHLPRWMWASINLCRLYMQAITITDITTFDGTTIPKEVYLVKAPYRQSQLNFPLPTKPTREQRSHWQYFIRYITNQNLELHVPLKSWRQTPHQVFPYILDVRTKMIHKKKRRKEWELYFPGNFNRKEYKSSNLRRKNLPKKWLPISVIQQSYNNLTAILPSNNLMEEEKHIGIGEFHEVRETEIVGVFDMNGPALQRLKEEWQKEKCKIVCGTDGGLKNGIGTSGYAIYESNRREKILTGHSSEKQPQKEASSTRQELRAQLAIFYWLAHLYTVFGEPAKRVEVLIVTDSAASLQIRENMKSIRGIKDVLKPDVDIALDMHEKEQGLKWAKIAMVKVKSHIAIEEATNDFYWELNDLADQLATKARQKEIQDLYPARAPTILEGTKAVCHIDGQLCNNFLNAKLKEQMSLKKIQEYLCNKHSWTDSIFTAIDWDAHGLGLKAIPYLQRITVIKLIHGWNATKRRRFQMGGVSNPDCQLCQAVETRTHIWECANKGFEEVREIELQKLCSQITKGIEKEVGNALQIGIMNISDPTVVAQYTKEFVVDTQVASAVEEQTEIGWDNFMFGRIATQWKKVAQRPGTDWDPDRWAVNTVTAVLQALLILWKKRNTLVHGTEGETSKLELERVQRMIEKVYLEIGPRGKKEHEWLFNRSLAERETENYTQKIAWLDGVRQIYPEKFKAVRENARSARQETRELEYTRKQAMLK